MCFLPKYVTEDENPAELARAPDNTRPLTLANTDSKVLRDDFSVGLTRAAPETIDPIQRGGIAGRGLLDNVVDIEWWGLRPWLTGGGRSGILFTDFRAAFPSLLTSWMIAVLAAMGFPTKFEASTLNCTVTVLPSLIFLGHGLWSLRLDVE